MHLIPETSPDEVSFPVLHDAASLNALDQHDDTALRNTVSRSLRWLKSFALRGVRSSRTRMRQHLRRCLGEHRCDRLRCLRNLTRRDGVVRGHAGRS